MAQGRERCVRVARGQMDEFQPLLFRRVARDVTRALAVANNPQTVGPVRVPKLRQGETLWAARAHVASRVQKWMSPNGRLAMFGLGAAKRSKLNVLQLRS